MKNSKKSIISPPPPLTASSTVQNNQVNSNEISSIQVDSIPYSLRDLSASDRLNTIEGKIDNFYTKPETDSLLIDKQFIPDKAEHATEGHYTMTTGFDDDTLFKILSVTQKTILTEVQQNG